MGKKEVESGTLSVRARDGSEQKNVALAEILDKMKEEIVNRR